MTDARRRAWLLIASFGASAALLKPVQDRVDARFRQPSTVLDVLYFGSPRVARALALGYNSLLADVYWMRSIQYYGRRDEAARRPVRYGNLVALLEITTELDPDLLDAYRFGGVFLAEPEPAGAGRPDQAIELLDRGIVRHPLEWRLYFDKGFTYFWFVKDYAKAAEAWLAASRLPTAPNWMEALAAMSLSRGGAVETARALWERQDQESNRQDVKKNARDHLISLRVDEDRWMLEFFVERYRKKFGAWPARLADLVRVGLLKYVPHDPSDTPYLYDPATGEVRLSPATGVLYLKIPYDYRAAFMEKLARAFGPN
ncbi:MAG: hypothetical protein DMG07_00710 [Acidobacteria bacterium]|nr:MAG: hypothetical protein DMG07_00710 [Acidobacteriota bacterium]